MRRKALILLAVAAAAVGALTLLSTQLLGVGERGPRYFLVEVGGERFVIYVVDPETIRLAEDNMRGLNSLFPIGELERGDGGFNKPWSWHLRPSSVRMVEVAIELCDGLPSHVERDLDYWVETVGRYCPWSARIVASSSNPGELQGSASPIK
ncbi:MAG: hypothetical protein QW555_05375 [Nitrososphaerota archaeon]